MTRAHDPTQADGQGPDIDFQYTSAIFTMDDDQAKTANALIAQYTKDHTFKNPIATKVLPFKNFYDAEDYHQEYFARHPLEGYCTYVVGPKVAKFRERFLELRKG